MDNEIYEIKLERLQIAVVLYIIGSIVFATFNWNEFSNLGLFLIGAVTIGLAIPTYTGISREKAYGFICGIVHSVIMVVATIIVISFSIISFESFIPILIYSVIANISIYFLVMYMVMLKEILKRIKTNGNDEEVVKDKLTKSAVLSLFGSAFAVILILVAVGMMGMEIYLNIFYDVYEAISFVAIEGIIVYCAIYGVGIAVNVLILAGYIRMLKESRKCLRPNEPTEIVSEEAIKVSNVSFAYHGRDVIKNMSIDIKKGEFICIVGENGGGKSTFVKCILGLNKNYRGSIEANQRISYLSQITEVQNNFPATIEEVVLSRNNLK